MSIHEQAVQILGPSERIAKLRRELAEAVNMIDRLDEGKATPDEVIDELFDVLYVARSLQYIDGWGRYNMREQAAHSIGAERKLMSAIEAKGVAA